MAYYGGTTGMYLPWGPQPSPSVLQLYLAVARESYYYGKAKQESLPGYEAWYYVESSMNRLLGESAPDWGRYSHPQLSRGSGGPSVAAPTSTDLSKRSESGRTSSAKGYSAHGFSSTKASTARGKCPKGHYWSYKKKKCVKSKFR